ncbi:MAG: aminotransferase class I/II-fold pyridoxal phosphate-dependent enzyme [Chitinophagales bacterium]|nr:aminotransferase class I/II-fold pyridoxal phosphate-dependent enzyme [Chitinophagales bacterium]MDW8428461.1 aminotransferase class I/II-fold pyridoxal phosphate-dependent enzyme [Chitinophagales bacterium]
MKPLHPSSLCVHELPPEADLLYAHTMPIAATTTYAYEDPEHLRQLFSGERKGYVYSRWANPTVAAAERKLAALEACGLVDAEGKPLQLQARLFSSGMAAISTLILALARPGAKIIAQNNLYGGTHEFFEQIVQSLGMQVHFLHLKDLSAVQNILDDATLLYVETPANPTLECYDLQALISLAHDHQVPVAVDNTFATPLLQQPFAYNADFVVYSATKFLNGHGNSIAGVLVYFASSPYAQRFFTYAKLLGNNSNAFDAWLLLNGLKTLAVRMERHCRNARAVAAFLQKHPAVAAVHYPGLSEHPDHQLARRQMSDYGALLSFELHGGWPAVRQFLQKLHLCRLAVSLGTPDTLVQHPASMSHAGVDPNQRQAAGITDGLIRLSVGLEDPNDLIHDLKQALEGIS